MATPHVVIRPRIHITKSSRCSRLSLSYNLWCSKSHLTFSLENFFLIDSSCSVHNSTLLDNVYLEIGIHFPMNFSCHLTFRLPSYLFWHRLPRGGVVTNP